MLMEGDDIATVISSSEIDSGLNDMSSMTEKSKKNMDSIKSSG